MGDKILDGKGLLQNHLILDLGDPERRLIPGLEYIPGSCPWADFYTVQTGSSKCSTSREQRGGQGDAHLTVPQKPVTRDYLLHPGVTRDQCTMRTLM